MSTIPSYLERSRRALEAVAREQGLLEEEVLVRARTLSPEEAIGRPGRRDFPLLKGKERLLEGVVGGSRGHAFTDAPTEFTGSLKDLLSLPLDSTRTRGPYVAVLNAVFRSAGLVSETVHCRDDDPESCAVEIGERVTRELRWPRVGLIGFNPALADELARRLGPQGLRITDLDPDNVGRERFGVPVWDGSTRYRDLIAWSYGVLVTGTTFVNGTFDSIWQAREQAGKPGVLFGVTAAGLARIFGFPRVCPRARAV